MIASTLAGRDRAPVALGRLWAGILLAPLAWSVTELTGYYLSSRECAAGASGRAGITQDLLAIGLGVIAVVGLVIAIANWQRVRETSAIDGPPTESRAHFMALVGVVASTLFVVGIVFFALPPFLINVCAEVR